MNSQNSIFNIQYSAQRGFTPTPVLASLRFSKTVPSSFWKFPQDLRQTMRSVGALKQWQNRCRGFTLVEMIVAIGLFTIVLFIASSAFLAVLDADRKSRATRMAMDNLNLSLEDMSRRIKTGTEYDCSGGASGTANCFSGGAVLAATDQSDERVIYKRGTGSNVITTGNAASGCGTGFSAAQGCIVRDKAGTALRVTGSDINITNLMFYVRGSAIWTPSSGDIIQPYVVIMVEGVATEGKVATKFNIQTTVTQRAYDI